MKTSLKELAERVKALEDKQAAKSGMAAKVRGEQLKAAVAQLRMDMYELKEKLKAEGNDNKTRHKHHVAALKELYSTVTTLKEQGLVSNEKVREIEQQSSHLLMQAASEAQTRDALFTVRSFLFNLLSFPSKFKGCFKGITFTGQTLLPKI